MNKFKKSQVFMLSLLTILLVIAPLLSSSLRLTYIYFITNLLIIALGAEAGLLSFFSKPNTNLDDKRNTSFVPQKPGSASEASPDKRVLANGSEEKVGPHDFSQKMSNNNIFHKVNIVEKSLSENKVVGSVEAEKVKKCPSEPSLFFIGGGDNEGDFDDQLEYHEDDVEEEVGEISGQELFAKAEAFIGNFYKQLKMQREESWKRIHGFYQRAF